MANRNFLLILFFLLSNSGYCQDHSKITPDQKQKLENLKKEVSDDLTKNILPYWTTRMVDNLNGGF